MSSPEDQSIEKDVEWGGFDYLNLGLGASFLVVAVVSAYIGVRRPESFRLSMGIAAICTLVGSCIILARLYEKTKQRTQVLWDFGK